MRTLSPAASANNVKVNGDDNDNHTKVVAAATAVLDANATSLEEANNSAEVTRLTQALAQLQSEYDLLLEQKIRFSSRLDKSMAQLSVARNELAEQVLLVESLNAQVESLTEALLGEESDAAAAKA